MTARIHLPVFSYCSFGYEPAIQVCRRALQRFNPPLNRRFFASIVALLAMQPWLLHLAQVQQLSLSATFSFLFAYWAALACMASISLDVQLFPMVVGYGVASGLSLHYPHANLRIMAVANFVFMLTLLRMGLPVLREDHERRLAERRSRVPPP